jgi:hypothetical protein
MARMAESPPNNAEDFRQGRSIFSDEAMATGRRGKMEVAP